MFRLAHISDPHIGPLPPVAARDLLGKRLLGYLSWRSRRHRIYRLEILDALRQDLKAQRPDHVVVTGDLVNIALPAEFDQAAAWLRALGPPEWISVIPGNHDAYVRIDHSLSLARWADYMASDPGESTGSEGGSGGFPYLRRRGPLALIGLSTAIATPPTVATGRLGATQLAALDSLLAVLAGEPCCRVVLLHHSPLIEVSGRRRWLVDAEAFCEIVRRRGADLILHGHEHVLLRGTLHGAAGPIQVAGVPSAASLDPRPERRSQYEIYEIEKNAERWVLRSQIRGYHHETGTFAPLPMEALTAC